MNKFGYLFNKLWVPIQHPFYHDKYNKVLESVVVQCAKIVEMNERWRKYFMNSKRNIVCEHIRVSPSRERVRERVGLAQC